MNNTRPMTATEIKALNILNEHRGKQNAIPYHDLAVAVGISQRQLREVIQGLINDHQAGICTSYDKDCGGYYLPKTAREIEETIYKLRKHGISILTRVASLKKSTLPEYLGQLQLELKYEKTA